MLAFLVSNLSTIIVAIVVFGLVGLAIYKMVKDSKAGRHDCGGGCGGCPNSVYCHPKKD